MAKLVKIKGTATATANDFLIATFAAFRFSSLKYISIA